jgi:hypothetical protein
MEKAFTLGAALRSERVQKACKTNQCDSFTEVCVAVKGDSEPCIHGKTIASIKGESFRIIEEKSTKGWENVFSISQQGERIIISVKDCFAIGAAIPTELDDVKN